MYSWECDDCHDKQILKHTKSEMKEFLDVNVWSMHEEKVTFNHNELLDLFYNYLKFSRDL